MGFLLFDQYSLLHYAVGVIGYFWYIPLIYTIIIHSIFEYAENTKTGMRFINTYLKSVWPGGKPKADNYTNILGDTISTILGWYSAYLLDKYAKHKHWYFST